MESRPAVAAAPADAGAAAASRLAAAGAVAGPGAVLRSASRGSNRSLGSAKSPREEQAMPEGGEQVGRQTRGGVLGGSGRWRGSWHRGKELSFWLHPGCRATLRKPGLQGWSAQCRKLGLQGRSARCIDWSRHSTAQRGLLHACPPCLCRPTWRRSRGSPWMPRTLPPPAACSPRRSAQQRRLPRPSLALPWMPLWAWISHRPCPGPPASPRSRRAWTLPSRSLSGQLAGSLTLLLSMLSRPGQADAQASRASSWASLWPAVLPGVLWVLWLRWLQGTECQAPLLGSVACAQAPANVTRAHHAALCCMCRPSTVQRRFVRNDSDGGGASRRWTWQKKQQPGHRGSPDKLPAAARAAAAAAAGGAAAGAAVAGAHRLATHSSAAEGGPPGRFSGEQVESGHGFCLEKLPLHQVCRPALGGP